MYTRRCLIKGEALISGEGWQIFSFIKRKAMGRVENFYVYYSKNKGRVSKFLKSNAGNYPNVTAVFKEYPEYVGHFLLEFLIKR